MSNHDHLTKGYALLCDVPLEERMDQWVWLLDKRISNRFFSYSEREALLQDLVCLHCGKKCGGHCDGS